LGVKTDALCLPDNGEDVGSEPERRTPSADEDARRHKLKVLCWGQRLGTLLRRGEAALNEEAKPLLVKDSRYALRGGMDDDSVIRKVYSRAEMLIPHEVKLALCIADYENITGTALGATLGDTPTDLLDAMHFVSAVALAHIVKPIAGYHRSHGTLLPADQITLNSLRGLPRQVLADLNKAESDLESIATHRMERRCREMQTNLRTLDKYLSAA